MKHALALLVVTACASSAKPVAQPTETAATEDAPPDRSSPPKASKPDCDAQYQKALAQVRANDYGAALVEVEAAIQCEPLPYYQTSAFVFACMSGNSQKASLYYATLPPDQQSLGKLCDRQKPPVDYRQDVASTEKPGADDDPPPPEEADETVVPAEGVSKKAECTEHIRKSLSLGGKGMHAAALAQAEVAIKCDPLPYYTSVAFMFACNSANAPKAKSHYKKLKKPEQEKLQQICIRNKTDFE